MLFPAELTKLCVSSNVFVTSIIMELSILTAGSDNTSNTGAVRVCPDDFCG